MSYTELCKLVGAKANMSNAGHSNVGFPSI